MKAEKSILSGKHFFQGDTACAEGGIYAGCRFFGGYPITPATEVAERMAERLPAIGGIYIQMEDEIASMCAVLGAAWGGRKSMTSTSGPGFSLMMENFGLGIMTETPCVLVNVQRAGPSTGLPTAVGQGDMMQARWGSHGVYEVIALCPSSPQEAFNLTVRAFNLSEKYRLPVLVMMDEVVGHMTEKVVIPEPGELEVVPRRESRVAPDAYLPFKPDADLVPPMVRAGQGYHIHVTGLTHDERGYPVITKEAQEKLVRRLCDKIRVNRKDILSWEEREAENADVLVVAYGITARIAMLPIQMARKKGLKVGLFRLITAWPFPEERLRKLAGTVGGVVVPEINYGQMVFEVERCVAGKAPVRLVSHMGGSTHRPEDILNAIMDVAKNK
ncbi:MAG: 2-oxoacid:acceptor oxidoreductase subunit alpha [Planctomycetota bacterium]|nr:2-oxoacid:acceptor oxidoreductase subunit alpha [Planctomycetota bacterium]